MIFCFVIFEAMKYLIAFISQVHPEHRVCQADKDESYI